MPRQRLSSFAANSECSLGALRLLRECFFTGDSQRAACVLRQTVCSQQVILSSILPFSEQSACSINTSQIGGVFTPVFMENLS